MTFTRNEVRGTNLFFQKRRFEGFVSEILRLVGLLREKFTFFKSIGTTKFSRSLRLSVYITGDKTFETDFSC